MDNGTIYISWIGMSLMLHNIVHILTSNGEFTFENLFQTISVTTLVTKELNILGIFVINE